MFGRAALLGLGFAATAAVLAPLAQERTRDQIPETYRWNLSDLFASDDEWRAAKTKLAGELSTAAAFKRTLAQSPQRLLDALELQSQQAKALSRLGVYATLSADQDTRNSTYQAMRQEMTQLWAAFSAAWSFLEPELLEMDAAAIERAMAGAPGLKPHAFYLRDVLRRKPHTLSAREEELLAHMTTVVSGPATTSGLLLNADLPWPRVKLSDGRDVRLDVAGYSLVRESANRADREKAMQAFFGAVGGFERTLGSTIETTVQAALFESRARHYESSLARSLDTSNVPESVYRELVDGVNRNLAIFHRYLQLRKRILGVPELHYYDLYAPLVADVPLEYTVEQAQKEVLAAVAPLGADYVSAMAQAFRGRWIDYYPTPGKRSGAYMEGAAYDVHPYLLLNYNGRYVDVSTLAHEL